jgi:hypothetical protein
MGDEILECVVCGKCGKQAEIYCDSCLNWHCLECAYREIEELEEQLPEDF